MQMVENIYVGIGGGPCIGCTYSGCSMGRSLGRSLMHLDCTGDEWDSRLRLD